jgi:Gpi18-like mannosyltransferase
LLLLVLLLLLLQLPSRIAHNWASMVLSSLLSVLTAWYFPHQTWASTGGLLLPNGLQLFIDRKGVGWTPPQ